jgi:type I restriction enzyme, S subunit
MAGEFPKDWELLPLERCLEALIDYRGRSPRKVSSGVPLITAKIVKGGRILPPEEFIAEEDYKSWMRRGIPQRGDVLVTTEAPLGEVGQLDGRKVALAQRLIGLRAKMDVLDDRFLKFAMQSRFVQDQLRARATGTTVHGVRQSELRKITLPIPPLTEQRAIAEKLGVLDDKIELNQRIDETLESIFRTLFEFWFMDFGPVRAKAEGRWKRAENLPGMPADMWDLWPSDFEDSELGEIPKGWNVGRFSDLASSYQGGTPSTSNPDFWSPDEVNWATVKDLSLSSSRILLETERRLSQHGLAAIGQSVAQPGTILFSSGAPVGYMAWTQAPSAVGTRVIAVDGRSSSSSQYLFGWLDANTGLLRERARGTTFPQLLISQLRESSIIIPQPSILKAFDAVGSRLWSMISMRVGENRALAALRTVLLPKFLSGEIRVGQGQ